MKAISEAVKGKYKMKAEFAPGTYRFKGETIDTTSCSLEELDTAVKNGFDVVELVKSTAKSDDKK